MTNLQLAFEKLKAARQVLLSVDSYLETCARLQVEANKLTDEAHRLLTTPDEMSEVKGE